MKTKKIAILLLGILFSCSCIGRAADPSGNICNQLPVPVLHSETPLKLKNNEFKNPQSLDDIRNVLFDYAGTLYKDYKLVGGFSGYLGGCTTYSVVLQRNDGTSVVVPFDITDIIKIVKTKSKKSKEEITELENEVRKLKDSLNITDSKEKESSPGIPTNG